MHLLHGFMGADWGAAAWQAALTSLGGMMFTVVRLRTGSLWLAIALHMLKNLAVMYSDVHAAGPAMVSLLQGVTVLVELAVVAYAVIAARREARATPPCRTVAS
jgi:membrane protease YdiL (CAAX protease family)